MKLTQLPLGARFEYDGEIFTKTGPMTAASEKHGQRMIPRYAVLKPADGFTPPPVPPAQISNRTIRPPFFIRDRTFAGLSGNIRNHAKCAQHDHKI